MVQNPAADREETQAYIAERLRIAGATQPVLLPEAAQLVHRYSKGIPRLINLICEHALISAYVEQVKPIPARIVESVSMELDLDQQPFVISPQALSGLREDVLPTTEPIASKPIANATDSLKDERYEPHLRSTSKSGSRAEEPRKNWKSNSLPSRKLRPISKSAASQGLRRS